MSLTVLARRDPEGDLLLLMNGEELGEFLLLNNIL